MKKWLVVYHFWFTTSKGFKHEIIERESIEEAREYADAKAYHHIGDFLECAAFVIEYPTE